MLAYAQKPKKRQSTTSRSATSPHHGYDVARISASPPIAGALQAKLAINEPGDQYEQEADRVAERAVRLPEPRLQRACACGGGCPKCQTDQMGQQHERLQPKRVQPSGTERIAAPPIVHEALSAPGEPLDIATRNFLEPRIGHDFSQVRVHTDAKAAESARAVKSLAYTVGRDVVFAAGRYEPSTIAGRQLLAHELAHVAQQDAGTALPEPVLQRYSHEDCTETDLRTHIWPADGIAKRKVDAAIAAVTASPVAASTQALFAKYFMTRTPDVATIASLFRQVKAGFDGNSYTYECEDDCDPGENAYSGWCWDIHLCMNNLRGRANDCIARTIIHEFTHKYAGAGHGWWFSNAYCYNACDTAGCPSNLSPTDALSNAYSLAGFAHEV